MPALLVALLAGWAVVRGRRERGLVALGVLAVTVAVAYALRWGLFELDPFGAERDPDIMYFPSGHTSAAAATGLAATVLATHYRRRLVLLLAGAWIAAVGVASATEGSHYPSDVLGAYALALAVAFLVDAFAAAAPGPAGEGAWLTVAGAAVLALAALAAGDGVGPRSLLETGWSGGVAATLLLVIGAALPVVFLGAAAQSARSAAFAA